MKPASPGTATHRKPRGRGAISMGLFRRKQKLSRLQSELLSERMDDAFWLLKDAAEKSSDRDSEAIMETATELRELQYDIEARADFLNKDRSSGKA